MAKKEVVLGTYTDEEIAQKVKAHLTKQAKYTLESRLEAAVADALYEHEDQIANKVYKIAEKAVFEAFGFKKPVKKAAARKKR